MSKRPMTLRDIDRIVVPADPQLSPDGRTVAFTQATPSLEQERTLSWIAAVDIDGGEPVRLTQGDRDGMPRWSPDGRTLAFMRSVDGVGQVFALPMDGGEPQPLTRIPEGVTGYDWSPDGTKLWTLSRIDLRGPAADEAEKKRRAGEPSEVKGLGYKVDGAGMTVGAIPQLLVVDVATGEATQLTAGDRPVSSPVWAPDNGQLAFAREDGDDLLRPWANSVWTIATDGSDATRVTDLGGSAETVTWAPDGSALLVSGVAPIGSDIPARLYLVDLADGSQKPVAHELDRTVMAGGAGAYPGALPRFSADGAAVVLALREGGCVHLRRFELATGETTGLLVGDDETLSWLTTVGDTHVGVVTTATAPAEIWVIDGATGATRPLTKLNVALLDEVEIVPAKPYEFTAPDGTVIEGWTYGAEPGNPKPTLLEIHGGPHSAWSPSFASPHRQELVAKGWVVLTINPRGSDGYGAEFFAALRGGWGRNDQDDFLSAVDQLVDAGIADPDRLAVFGYSYGGYMTNWLVTQTDRFKAAVSGAGICDLVSFTGSADLGSAFMRAEFDLELHDKPELYRELSPLTYVNNVTTPILILHGTADTRTPLGQAEQWFTSLRRRGVEVEMVLYPGESHALGAARLSNRTDFFGRVIDWVSNHVSPEAN